MARRCRTARMLLLGVASAALPLGSSVAQPGPTVFGGVGVGADRLAYAGVTVPFSTANAGGLAVRAIISGSENKYRGAGVTVESEEIRGEAALLYQRSGPWGYFDVGAGARYTDTDLSPDDPGNPNRGGQWDPIVSMSGESSGGDPWQVAGFASYGFESEEYFARAELTRAVTPFVRLGAEAVFDGDPNYDRRRAGAVLAFGRSDWQVRVAVGGAESKGAKDGTYGSVGFRRSF